MLDLVLVVKILLVSMFAIFCLLNTFGFTMDTLNAERENKPLFRIASIIMILLAVKCIFYVDLILPYRSMESNDSGQTYERFVMLADLLVVPAVVILLRRLVRISTASWRSIFYHMTLPVLFIFVYLMFRYDIVLYFILVYYAVYTIVSFLSIMRGIHLYERALQNMYVNTSERSLRWIYIFVALLLFKFGLWGITRNTLTTNLLSYSLYFTTTIFLWWWLSSMLRRQVLNTSEVDVYLHHSDLSYETSSLKTGSNIKTLIDEFFQNNTIYHRPEYTANQLALELGVLIEELQGWFMHSGTNFRDFITNKRLQDVAHMLETSDEDPFVISARCGFTHNNKFRSAFRQKFGCSPEDYRDLHITKAE